MSQLDSCNPTIHMNDIFVFITVKEIECLNRPIINTFIYVNLRDLFIRIR